MFSVTPSACEDAKTAFIEMSKTAHKVVGLAKYQPATGEQFTVSKVFGVVNSKLLTEIAYLSIELADGGRFDLVGEMDRHCCESIGYYSAMPTNGIMHTWPEVTPQNVNLYVNGPDSSSNNSATTIYICEVNDQTNPEVDSTIIAFTDNPSIPLIGFNNYHNGYYSHSVYWSFTGPDGQELATGGTCI